MAVLSIAEASQAVGVSKSTIYKKIRDGMLSATTQSDGSKGVDADELFRVFGEAKPETVLETAEAGPEAGTEEKEPARSREVELLQQQVELLQQQLKACQEREQRLLARLEERWLVPGAVQEFFKCMTDTINRILGTTPEKQEQARPGEQPAAKDKPGKSG